MLRRIGTTGLLLVVVALTGCIKVPHLGDQAGKAYDEIFARQERNNNAIDRPKAMEGELAAEAARQLVGSGQAAKATAVGVAGGFGK